MDSLHPEAGSGQLDLRIRELQSAPVQLRDLEVKLRELRADGAEAAGEVEVQIMEWLRERQDAETHLSAYRDRARELKLKLDSLTSTGEDAPCPTCGRHLKDHFADVVDYLRDEWDSVVQDGTWWRRRRDQLELKPDAVQEVESRSVRLNSQVEDMAEQVELARSALRELEDLREIKAELQRRRRRVTDDAERLVDDPVRPGDYDRRVEAEGEGRGSGGQDRRVNGSGDRRGAGLNSPKEPTPPPGT